MTPEINGKLIINVKYSGIAIKTFLKGSGFAGEICCNNEETIELVVKDKTVKRKSDYVIYVSK